MRVVDVEQGTLAWKELRTGVITGTRLEKVMGTPYAQKSLLNELIAEKIAPPKYIDSTEAMERGHFLEPEAISRYELETGEITETVGFCLHDEYDWLGLSPDRFIESGKHYKKAVESKSPDTKTHVGYLIEKSIPKDYQWQVVQYFLVNEKLQELDFVTYDPRVTIKSLQIGIITVKRKELKELDYAMDKLLAFRERWELEEARLTF